MAQLERLLKERDLAIAAEKDRVRAGARKNAVLLAFALLWVPGIFGS